MDNYEALVHSAFGGQKPDTSDPEVLAWLIRRNGLEMSHISRGSHIGSVFSVAEIIAVLYTEQYTEEQQCIMWVRPGITDRSSIVYIAQDEIVGEEDPVANFERLILPEKNRLRVEYAKKQSFKLDAGLFFETIKGVFKKADDMRKENK